MNDLKYTITKFDNEHKIVTVTFEDGGWAEIRLTKPLPQNVEDLEKIIKQFAAPLEAVEAVANPDADLSYVSQLIGQTRTTTRFQLTAPPKSEESQSLDAEVEANLLMWEDINFQKKVGDALVKLGVVSENPVSIPVASI